MGTAHTCGFFTVVLSHTLFSKWYALYVEKTNRLREVLKPSVKEVEIQPDAKQNAVTRETSSGHILTTEQTGRGKK
jgi:hypothetical protein